MNDDTKFKISAIIFVGAILLFATFLTFSFYETNKTCEEFGGVSIHNFDKLSVCEKDGKNYDVNLVSIWSAYPYHKIVDCSAEDC